MAELLISVILETVVDKLASSIGQEFRSLWNVEKEVEKLSNVLSTLKSVLKDAEKKQFRSNEVSDWLRRLKHAAYDAEDVLDEFSTKALPPEDEREIQTSKRNKVHRMCCSCFTSNPVLFRHEMAHKIDKLLRRFEGIAAERKHLNLRETDGESNQRQIRDGRDTNCLIHESDVVGRESEKENLIKLLLSDCSVAKENDLSVISIVGMGGVGKTTLAQLVYNDERVKEHFKEVKGWVCVSEDFDSKRVLRAIIESTTKKSCDFVESNSLAVKIKEIVSEKKFLLVFDDVWNDQNPDQWEKLITPLRCGANGSKIILTTRIENVLKNMGTIDHYPLGILSNDECWLLLRKYAFPNGGWDEHQDLVVIGRKIAEKCKGLPLAARTLGGLLKDTREKKEWKEILDNEIWEISHDGEDTILAPLRLSYHHLPSHLKQCFLYCSIFPKDHEFNKEKLVKLWMAEEFITVKGQREIEDVGCRYFDELLWRSFFQCEKNQFGRLIYKMHDMIHDLAQSVSKDECFRMDGDRLSDFSEKIRYLSSISHKEIDPEIFKKVLRCKGLHTLQGIRIEGIPSSNNLSQRLKFLRVLDLHVGDRIEELPDSIGNLKLLRYLAIASSGPMGIIGNFILPESMSSLYNLQTLDLHDCWRLVELPKDTQNLIKLRHLFLPVNLSVMPKGIGRLTCLRTLSDFIVGKEPGRDIGQLIGLINLRGGLRIKQLQNAVNPKEDVFKDKEFMEKLDLLWDYGNDDDGDASGAEEILERLQPHPANLRELNIWRYVGERFSSWIGNPSFSKLVDVRLSYCDSCETLPPLWQLPSLKRLKLWEMAKVTCLFCADGIKPAFPSLEELLIRFCPNLVEWNGGTEKEGDLPCLRKLDIDICKSLIGLPRFLPSLHELGLDECNERILSSVPYFTSLSSLYIGRIENLKAIPSGIFKYLKALKMLDIYNCRELKSLVQKDDDDEEDSCKHLHSLESLSINHCPLLEVLPDGLKNLISLTILNCGALATLPEEGLPLTLHELTLGRCNGRILSSVSYFTSLSYLEISGMENLKAIPSGIFKYLKALKKLAILQCFELESLVQKDDDDEEDSCKHLHSLESLDISHCPLLKVLPDGLKNLISLKRLTIKYCGALATLPEGLPPTLQFLSIEECSLLTQRCKVGGQDWSKISDIPTRRIIDDGSGSE